MKSELTTTDLQKAFAEARLVRQGFDERRGLEIGELTSPLIYGVLTHTHKLPGKEPREVVTKTLLAEAQKNQPPRRQLGIVCMANLDCWYRTTNILQYPVRPPGPSQPSENDNYFDFWYSAYAPPEITGVPPLPNPNPIATLVTQLWARLTT